MLATALVLGALAACCVSFKALKANDLF